MNMIDDGRNDLLNDIRSVLVRRKWQILITFAAISAAAAVITFRMPKQYEAHMKILVKNERADVVVTAGSNSGSGYLGEVSEGQINTEIELLNSDSLLREVVQKCGLEKLEPSTSFVPGDRQQVAVEKAVLRLQKALKISAVRKANVIEVSYTTNDSHRAAPVLRQLSESYLEAHLRLHSTPGTYEFFSNQTAHYLSELKDSEAKLAEFRQKESVVMLAEQKEVMLQRASESESALHQAEAAVGEYTDKIADTRKQLAAAPARVVTQSRTMPNQYSVERLSTMLAELQNKRTGLLAKFRPDDRLVQEVDQEIADTRASLDRAQKLTASEQSTDVNPVRQALEGELAKEQTELAGTQARRQALARQAASYRQQLMTLGNATSQYDDLTRSQKEAEENYLLYARKTEEARIAESLDRQKIANVAIAETPVEPFLPSKPNVRLNLALGVILAAFISLGLAFTLEYLQQPSPRIDAAVMHSEGQITGARFSELIEQSSDLEALTGLPVLAITHRS